MPKVRKRPGLYSLEEVHRITGISRNMINYLRQLDMLSPSCSPAPWPRGRVRYYSFRDLVIGKMIKKLTDAGVQLQKVKAIIEYCKKNAIWDDLGGDAIRYVATDGKTPMVKAEDGFFEDASGQRSFAFAVDLHRVKGEVIAELEQADRDVASMKAPSAEEIAEIYAPLKKAQ